ncbi:MAG: hypothetical protein HY815_06355 [Candidatus Riflebacteria bacterium]|nr:hypothetical protein [Candidatus Riflebacteria bacterium]
MKRCGECGFDQADTMVHCVQCGHRLEGAPAPPDPKELGVMLTAALSQAAQPPSTGYLQPFLLVVALPVVVPALILGWLVAGRWGRRDGTVLAAVTLALLVGTVPWPPLCVTLLLAALASGLLLALRQSRLDGGMVLGYSSAVAWRLVASGALLGIGVGTLVPWGAAARIASLLWRVDPESVASLASPGAAAGPRAVRIDGPAVDRSRILVRVDLPTGPAVVDPDRGAPVRIEDPGDLWTRRQELLGRWIYLTRAPVVDRTYERSTVELIRARGGFKEVDRVRRIHAPVAASGGRVWLVSEPVVAGDAAVRQFVDRSLTGLLVHLCSDPELRRSYAMHHKDPLPQLMVGLLAGRPPPMPVALESYMPFQGVGDALWAAFPGALPGPLGTTMLGVYETGGPTVARLLATVRERAASPEAVPRIGLVRSLSPAEYVDREHLLEGFQERIGWSGLLWIVLGSLLLIWAIALCMEE